MKKAVKNLNLIKNKKGVTLTTLVITVVVLIILTFTIAVNFAPYMNEKIRTEFQSDLHTLKEAVDQYYARTGQIPKLEEYTGDLSNIINDSNVQNVNDRKDNNENATYYIVDVEALGLELNYGKDASKNDVYIINSQSHTVYYPEGKEYDGGVHYRLDEIFTAVKGNVADKTAPTVNKPVVSNITTNSFKINVVAVDEDSGIDSIIYYYKKKGESTYKSTTDPNSIPDGTTEYEATTTIGNLQSGENIEYEVYVVVYDKNGNKGESSKITVTLEKVVIAKAEGATTDPDRSLKEESQAGWANKDRDRVTVTLPINSESGYETVYQIGTNGPEEGKWVEYDPNNKPYATENGKTIYYAYTDGTNIGPYNSIIIDNIDRIPPDIEANDIVYGQDLEIVIRDIMDEHQIASKVSGWKQQVKDWQITTEPEQPTQWNATPLSLRVPKTITGLNVGTYYIWARDLAGNVSYKEVNVTEKEITQATLEKTDYTYDGEEKKPTVIIKDGEVELKEGIDYRVIYSNNTDVGEATVTIEGIGNYGGTITKHFTINKLSVSKPTHTANLVYNGIEQTGVTGITASMEKVSGDTQATNAGTYTAVYKLKDTKNIQWEDGTSGNITINWTIAPKELEVTWKDKKTFEYNGQEQAPEVTTPIDGVNGEKVDIKVIGKQVNVGSNYTATADINKVTLSNGTTGTNGNYKLKESSKIAKFEITARNTSDFTTTLGEKTYTYDGTAKEPSVTIKDGNKTLEEGKDYEVEYKNNINAGTAEVVITYKGNYSGTKTETFTINKLGIDKPTAAANLVYSGQQQTGIVGDLARVTKLSGSIAETNAGEYSAIYKLKDTDNTQWKDGTTDNIKVNWVIAQKELEVIWSEEKSFEYNGEEQVPKVTTPMNGVNGEKVDIAVTGKQVNVGTGYIATAVISKVTLSNGTTPGNTENYKLKESSKTTTFAITGKNTTNFTVTLGEYNKEYDNTEKKPAVTIKDGEKTLELGKDFTIEYVNNVNAGTATVTITYKGNYIGTKSINFVITQKEIPVPTQKGTLTYTGEEQQPAWNNYDDSVMTIGGTQKGTNAGEYTVTFTLKDPTNTKWADGTKTSGHNVTWSIEKQQVNTPTNVKVSTAGIVTWDTSSNATSYQISLDGEHWEDATSGIDYLAKITAATGDKTIYVRAVNSDTTNYLAQSANATAQVTVVALTIASSDTNKGTIDTASYNVIKGATFTTNDNKLTIKGVTTGTTTKDLKVVTATPKTGYHVENWVPANGTANAATTITATFEASKYTVTVNANGGTIPATTGWTVATGGTTATKQVTFDSAYGDLPTPTRTGYTFNGWKNGDADVTKDTKVTTASNHTITAQWTINKYNITWLSGNLVYGLENKVETTTSYMKYSINNGTVTVTATCDDGYGYTTGRAYLEEGKTYIFNCTTNGTWGTQSGTDTVQAFLMPDGQVVTGKYKHMNSNNDFEFTPTVTGEYWLRLDVNQNGKTYTFSNISIYEKVKTEQKDYNSAIGTLSAVSRTGYTLDSWYTEKTAGDKVTTATKVPANDVTYYTHWTPNTYTVSFNGNGGTGGQSANVTATYNAAMSTIVETAPTRAGYTFMGWYDNATYTSGTQYYTATGASAKNYDKTENTTLFAGWKINQYTLTINPNGGTWNSKTTSTTVSQNYGTTYNVANNATRTGYVFGGWKLTSGKGNITWYQESEKKQQFLINSSSAAKPVVYNNERNGTVTHTIISDSTSSTGYSMKIVTDGVASPNAGGFVNSVTAVSGTIYYHKIVAKIPTGYTINYASNSAGVGYGMYWLTDTAGTGDWATYIYAEYSGYNSPFSSFGHVYLKGTNETSVTWYVQESTIYQRGANLTALQATNLIFEFADSNATLTAQWSTSGSGVTFDRQGGTFGNGTIGTKWTTSTKTYRYLTAYPNTKEAPYYISSEEFAIYKDGYTLDGWYTAATGGTKLFEANGQLIPSVSGYSDANRKWQKYDSSFKIYARWTANKYTVTANASGGTIPTTTGWTVANGGATATKVVTFDGTYGDLPTPTRDGYTFAGWKNGTTDVTNDTNVRTASDHTLIAQWTANNYTIKFHNNGGTGTMADETMTYDVEKALTKNTFTKTGYEFVGWATTENGTKAYDNEQKVKNLTSEKNGVVDLYAKWTPRTDIRYVVKHYTHNLDENKYTLADTEEKQGTADATITVANLKKTIAGFTYVDAYTTGDTTKPTSGAVTTTTVAPDGTRVINLYYRRNFLYVQYDVNGGALSETHGTGYGTTGTLITYTGNSEPTKFWVGVYGGTVNNEINASTYKETTNGLHDYNYTTKINIIKTGYTAKAGAEWNTKANGTGTSYNQKTSTYEANNFAGIDLSTGDKTVTLYVNWELVNYTITYNLNGGANASANPGTYNITTNTITLADPTKTGYTFTGWTGEGITTPTKNVQIVKGSTGNKTYTANWEVNKYDITYNYNMNNYTFESNAYIDTDYVVNWDKDFTLSAVINIPAQKNRYLIFGNYVSTSSTSKDLNLEINTSNQLRVWINGAQKKVSTGTIAAGTDVTITFTWQASTKTYTMTSTGTNSNASVTGTYEITGSPTKTLRVGAKDHRTATSPYKPYTLKSVSITKQYEYDTTLSDLPSAVTATGYTYNGWHTDATGGNPISSTTQVPANNKTYYAHWTANTYTIKYWQGNNSTTAGKTQLTGITTGTYDQNVTLQAYNGTAPTGWTFAGWATTQDGTTVAYTNSQANLRNLTSTANGTVDLYAVFQRTINVYSGTKKATNNPQIQNYNPYQQSKVTSISLAVPADISGWDKLGYRTNGSAAVAQTAVTTEAVTVTPAYSEGAVTYYAVYKRTATFYSGENKASANTKTADQYYNTNNAYSVAAPAPATITNWTAIGYKVNTDANNTAVYGKATSSTITNAVGPTFYAVYSRSYKATFYSGVNKATTNKTKDSSTAYYNTNSATLPTTVSITLMTAADSTDIENWTELGWRDDTETGDKEYAYGATVTVPFGTNFYSVYSRSYTAHFYSGTKPTDKTKASSTVYYNTNTASTPTQVSIALMTQDESDNISGWDERGWRTDTTKTDKQYEYGKTVTVDWGTNFYSVYQRITTLEYRNHRD